MSIRGKSRDTNIYSQRLSPSGPHIDMINLDAGALFGGDRTGFYYIWLPEN